MFEKFVFVKRSFIHSTHCDLFSSLTYVDIMPKSDYKTKYYFNKNIEIIQRAPTAP